MGQGDGALSISVGIELVASWVDEAEGSHRAVRTALATGRHNEVAAPLTAGLCVHTKAEGIGCRKRCGELPAGFWPCRVEDERQSVRHHHEPPLHSADGHEG